MQQWLYIKVVPENVNGQIELTDLYVTAAVQSNQQYPTSGSAIEVQNGPPELTTSLWQWNSDGTLSLAFFPSLVIGVGSDSKLVLQESSSSNPAWQIVPVSATKCVYIYSPGSGYFNIDHPSSIDSVSGTPLIAYEYQIQWNNWWTLVPYTPTSGQWFTLGDCEGWGYLVTAMAKYNGYPVPTEFSGQLGTAYAVTDPETGLPLPSLAQLWKFCFNGTIASALSPNLLLTMQDSGSFLACVQSPMRDANNPSQPSPYQIWEIRPPSDYGPGSTSGIALYNVGTGGSIDITKATGPGFLSIYGEENEPGTYLCGTYATHQNVKACSWNINPLPQPLGQWVSIRSNLSSSSSDLVLTIPGDTVEPLTALAVSAPAVAKPNSIWRFTFDGLICSAIDPDTVLSVVNNTVVILPLQPGLPSFQRWVPAIDGTIRSCLNGQVLTANQPNAGDVTLSPVQSAATTNQIWQFAPGRDLQVAALAPPIPFPTAENQHLSQQAQEDDAAGYAAISTLLGLGSGGVRRQYSNLAAPLAAYQCVINAMPMPAAIQDKANWQNIQGQLNKELTAVQAVQSLFQQVNTLFLSLSQAQSYTFGTVVAAASMGLSALQPQTKVKTPLWQIFEGMVYTALSAVTGFEGSVIFPVIANVMNTAFGVGQNIAAQQAALTKATNVNLFEGTVAQLEQSVLTNFQTCASVLGMIEERVLTDYGKIMSIAAMIAEPVDQKSLYWPPLATSMLVPKLLPGFTIGLLQALLPVTATITAISKELGYTASSQGQLSATTYADQFEQDGTHSLYTAYAISSDASASSLDEVMNMVWQNGGIPFQFFHALGGWSQMPLTQSPMYKDRVLIMFVQNFSDQTITVTVTVDSSGDDGFLINSYNTYSEETLTLNPYCVLSFGVYNPDNTKNIDGNFTFNIGSTQIASGSFSGVVTSSSDAWVFAESVGTSLNPFGGIEIGYLGISAASS